MKENIALGVVVIVATALAMALGDALVKLVSADFTVWQIYVLRSLVAIPVTVVLLLGSGRAAVRPRSFGWVCLRSALLMVMWLAFYAALPVLSLPVAAAAYYTGPLFITLFSAALIGEPVGPRRWAAIMLGFVGILAILRPGTEAFSYLTLLPIASAVAYALAAIVTRAKCIDERPLVLSLALNVAFMIVGIVGTAALVIGAPTESQAAAYPFLLGRWTAMGLREWSVILLLAVLIVAIGAGVAKAYQSGPPAVIATFDYTYLVFAAIWSFAFFSELPDAMTVTGMLLIAGAGIIAVAPARNARRALNQSI